LEENCSPHAGLVAQENSIPKQLNGRSVFADHRERRRKPAGTPLSLFPEP
jgi:hypothetical protein